MICRIHVWYKDEPCEHCLAAERMTERLTVRQELCEQHGEYESKYGKGCPICLAEVQRKKLQERLIEDAEKEAEAIFVEPRTWHISYNWILKSPAGRVLDSGFGSCLHTKEDGSPLKASDLEEARQFVISHNSDAFGNTAEAVILNIIEISPE